MDDIGALVLILCFVMCTIIAVVGMVLDHEKKKARRNTEPPPPPAPSPSRTSVLAGFSFVSGLIAIFMVTAAGIMSACISMSEVTGIQESVHASVNLAARIVLYVSLLPAVGAVALALGARGAIKESRETLGGRSLYRTGLFLSILSGVLALDAKIVTPASWRTLGSPGGAGGAGGVLSPKSPRSDPNRGYLGIEHEAAAASGGIRVLRVLPGTPAERAGIKAGDCIIQFDGVPVAPGESVADRISERKPGTSVEIMLQRDGVTLQVTAVLTAPFASLLELLEDAITDAERLTLLETAGAERQFTSEELKQVCETFIADPARERAVAQVLPRVVDPQNAYQVLPTFIATYIKQNVSRKIADLVKSKK
jgi:hypothetical protein